jgi:hypothetical protein
MNLVQLICCALLTKAADLGEQYLPTGQRRLQVANANAALQATIEEIAQTGSSLCVCDTLEDPYKATATPQPVDGRRTLRNWRQRQKLYSSEQI